MEESTVNTFVGLFGDENELKQLRDFLDSPNCRLEQFKEMDERYYLTACRFSNLADDEKVRESAKKLVIMIRALAKIELGGDFQSINIGRGASVLDTEDITLITKRAEDSQNVSVVPPTNVSKSLSVDLVTVDGPEPSEREKRLHDDYLSRCDEEIDRTVFDALYYFAQPTSWFSLYKIYELITFDLYDESNNKAPSEMIKERWVDEGKLSDFLFSAQYYDVVGDAKDAYFGVESGRHSWAHYLRDLTKRKKSKADNPQDSIMQLTEAENLIRTILEAWLESKQTS